MCLFPTEAEEEDTLPSCFSSYSVNKRSLSGLFVLRFYLLLCLLLAILLFKMDSKCRAEVPSISKVQGGSDEPYRENTC